MSRAARDITKEIQEHNVAIYYPFDTRQLLVCVAPVDEIYWLLASLFPGQFGRCWDKLCANFWSQPEQ